MERRTGGGTPARPVAGRLRAGVVGLVLIAAAATPAAAGETDARAMTYPPAPRGDQVDDYHGTRVADPYRWLEDLDSPATRSWVEAENRLSFGYLEAIPQREAIRRRLTELWNHEQYGVPQKEGGRYFFTKNDGLQNQSVVYVLDRLDGEPRALLDPNTLSADGTVALSDSEVSHDGKRMAYGLSRAGSDWEEWKVRDVATGKDLDDHLRWIKFSRVSWSPDDAGFYYSRFAEPKAGEQLEGVNYFQKLYYHRIGDPQSADRLVYERPDHKEWGFDGRVTDDGRYLILSIWQGTETRSRIFYRDLREPGAKVVELLADFDAAYQFLGNDGPLFWFMTDLDAPRGRVIAIDVRQPGRGDWREVVPQAADALQSMALIHDLFVAHYLADAHSEVKLFDLSGKLVRRLELPELGTASGFTGHRADSETFYSFTTFTSPAVIYRYDLASGQTSVFRRPKLGFDPSLYETRQVFYTSKDGTRVPMFIVAKKGLELDGDNPTLLYGYGGFAIPITPGFSASTLVWMERGGVYAVANLRGGGEYGEDWHQAGMKLKKQNVFDDFIAAAEWLIANHYTRTPRLAITGRSNGGLLVGAALTQRPDLFGCTVPSVGVMDMLRFDKFTIGWGWVSDYGSPDDPQEFKALYAYSPYHNIRPGTHYPPTLVTTGDHDDRVVPGHSFKFAAALQAAQAGPAPVLIRIDTNAGHGAGKPTTKRIEESADILAFIVHELDAAAPAAREAAHAGATF